MADEQLRRERDLYRRLLELDAQCELGPLLREALALIVDVTGARLGYLEVHEGVPAPEGSRWSAAHGMTDDEVTDARAVMSRGIIAEALATGKTIVTPSALLDPRFLERRSVRMGSIEAVLCAPVGLEHPVGVLYLQGSNGERPFTDEDRVTAELFARHLAPLADRLLVREQHDFDPTRVYRATLELGGVIGRSAALAALFRQVALVAPLDVSVLLTGASGTGKSQIARVIHDNGPRARRPFVELNCAALPDALIESELFGALPGAHSTATRRMEGKVAAAEGGTLLLDEVGDLSLPAQAKLLQLMQSKEYFPLGGARPVRADVRLLAATNVDLQGAVRERRFRQDLLYRLEVLPVHLPALAQRRDDVPLLATHFCAEASRRHQLPALVLSSAALHAVASAQWPGNVRQLQHAIEAAVIRAVGDGGRRVERHHLFAEASATVASPEALTFQEGTRRFQKAMLRDALEASDWNVLAVAERLNLARSHVYNLIRAFALTR
jgi:Nif-specific regulatory protein